VVRSGPVKSIVSILLVLLLGVAMPAYSGEDDLALIVSAHSEVDTLDPLLARRLFLGLTVTRNGVRLRPVLNESDPRIKALFFKDIVAMSDHTYDRYVLRLALLQGRTEPAVFASRLALLNAVASDPTVVGYMWAKDAARDPRVRILRTVSNE
jgi:hypothetical protein